MNTMPSLQERLPGIFRCYVVALILLGVIAVMLPGYFEGGVLVIFLIAFVFLAIVTLGMSRSFRFQKIHPQLRPFIVARILQGVSVITAVALILLSVPDAAEQGTWIPHAIFWLLVLALVSRYTRVFHYAEEAKQKMPDRCEFC